MIHRHDETEPSKNAYRQAINTNRSQPFNNNHPIERKIGCFRALFNRINTHCSRHYSFTTSSALIDIPQTVAQQNVSQQQAQFLRNGWISASTVRIILRITYKQTSTLRSQQMKPKTFLKESEKLIELNKINVGCILWKQSIISISLRLMLLHRRIRLMNKSWVFQSTSNKPSDRSAPSQ